MLIPYSHVSSRSPHWSPDDFYSQWEENALAANTLLEEIDDLNQECGLFHMWKSETDEQQEQLEQQIGFRYSEQHFSYPEIRRTFLRERAKPGAPRKDRSLFRKALDMRHGGKSYGEIVAEICDCGAKVHDEKQMELCSDRFSKGVTAIRKSLKNYPDIHVPEWCQPWDESLAFFRVNSTHLAKDTSVRKYSTELFRLRSTPPRV